MNALSPLLFLPALPTFGRTAAPSPTPPNSEALERRLRQAIRRGRPVVLGTATAPFSPGASTRPLLTALSRAEGLEISITTRSPLLLRDLELLVDLDRRSVVTVRMMIPTVDPELAERLEPQASTPEARLRAVRQLAEEGIETRIVCSPWLPGQSDREAVWRPLFAAAREAWAYDVLLPRDRRDRRPSPAGRDRRLALFHRLRLEYGFPQPLPGRG
jgi:DNA repair photolyase